MTDDENKQSERETVSASTMAADEVLESIDPHVVKVQHKSDRKSRVIVIMPAYNAATTLEKTIADMPLATVDEVILVDDGSSDGTPDLARRLGLTVIEHEKNRGYGGNQKTCYAEALARDADIVVMVHPDYQYDSRVIDIAVKILQLGTLDFVMGCRIRTRKETLEGGMPVYKYLANRVLTTIENVALGQNLGDFHSGFRAYRRGVLETIPFESNSEDFVFDSQFLAQAVHFGFKIGDIPVPVRYFDEASSINFRRSLKYGFATLGVLVSYWLNRIGLRKSKLFRALASDSGSKSKSKSKSKLDSNTKS